LFCAPCQGALFSPVKDRAGKLSLQPEALGADQEATNGLKGTVNLSDRVSHIQVAGKMSQGTLPPNAADSRPDVESLGPGSSVLPRLIKLLIRARQFNAALVGSDGVPFAALTKREGVSRSYFTRLVRLSYLAPDITEAILDGRQPRDLTADKLLAHSRLPLGWHEQRTVLGFA
jgi:hypothetical protein